MVVRTRRVVAEMGKNELNSIYSKVESVEFDEGSRDLFNFHLTEEDVLEYVICRRLTYGDCAEIF